MQHVPIDENYVAVPNPLGPPAPGGAGPGAWSASVSFACRLLQAYCLNQTVKEATGFDALEYLKIRALQRSLVGFFTPNSSGDELPQVKEQLPRPPALGKCTCSQIIPAPVRFPPPQWPCL
jgi:hypothetical protein